MFKRIKAAKTENEVILKGKTTNQVIEEIHETFYTEVNRILADAKIPNSLVSDKKDLIEKRTRLSALGFVNTKEMKAAELELDRLAELMADNEAKKRLAEAINYFSFKYPNYKFITEKSVRKICEKYNLVYGDIEKYIGTVPDKNIKHMEDFTIHESDECFMQTIFGQNFFGDNIPVLSRYFSFEDKKKHLAMNASSHMETYSRYMTQREAIEKCPLEIVAPVKDFDMKDHKLEGFKISKIEIPDPVVLKPVFFKNEKHYLIVTAWGLEAADDLILNANHN